MKNFKNLCRKNKFHFLAFAIPVVSMLIVYYFKDIIPFGNQMYLRSDCYHQYAPFLQVLQDKLRSGGSLFYSWEFGGGMNFWSVATYYLSSPLNLLILIWPAEVSDFVSFSIIVKMGLAGFTTSYYLTKHFNKNSILTAAIGSAYGLSSYFAAFSWNIMWLDCLWLLPIIVLGLEKLVEEKKCRMYAVSLGIALFSNYYIGFMICIFSVIYFLYLFLTKNFGQENSLKERLLVIKDYVLYSLLSGALSAIMVIPAYLGLMNTVSAKSDWRDLTEYFSVFYVFLRSLIATPIAELKNYPDPNVYCTVAAFFLIPMFCLCRKIPLRERIGKTAIAAVLLFSMCFNLPTYIWHGFHYPNSLSGRFSFLYIFIILVMCYEALLHIRSYKNKQIFGSVLGSIALILLCKAIYDTPTFLNELYNDNSSSDGIYLKMVYCSILFILIYFVFLLWYRAKPHLKGFIAYIMILTVFCELTFNLALTTIVSTQEKASYYNSVDSYAKLNDFAQQDADDAFYRAQTASFGTKNDGARYRYRSISTFCSVSLASTQTYYDAIGLQVSTNSFSHYGITPVTAALYALQYEYTDNEPTFSDAETFLTTANENNVTLNLYKFNRSLPLGFMIKSNTMAKMKAEVVTEQPVTGKDGQSEVDENGKAITEDVYISDPFAVQNSFVNNSITNAQTVFHKLKTQNGSITASYDMTDVSNTGVTDTPQTMDIYFYCMTSNENLTATINGAQTTVAQTPVAGAATTTATATTAGNSKSFSDTDSNYICHIGNVPAGATVTLSDTSATCYAYAYDAAAWEADHQQLSSETYHVTTADDTKLEGTITVKNTGLMYTSIPYEKGWKVYVDGNRAETLPICGDSLTGVVLSPGQHTVVFKYTPAGFVPGLIITILAIIMLFLPYEKIWAFVCSKVNIKSEQKKAE